MLYYVPLEGYKERYTLQWSAPITGWLESRWRQIGLKYHRVDPELPMRPIKTGCVLDAVGRSVFCFEQIKMLLSLAEEGKITNDDVIYFDDFWTPGLEALPYAFHLMGIKPKMYAFLHAQSVDEFDFTYPMREWMRPFEKGIARALNGIFVCGHTLKDLVVNGDIAPPEKVYVTGHPFNSDEVINRMREGIGYHYQNRSNNVVWSSRWDQEKNPQFFLAVAAEVIEKMPDAKFIICTGSKQIRSNNDALIMLLHKYREKWTNNIILKEDLTKEQYYAELLKAKIQFNCASQDFVAITLLEASVAGCYPVYPYFRSFPETFAYRHEYMYEHLDLDSAVAKVCSILKRSDLWTEKEIWKRSWIHRRFDCAWERMLIHMRYDLKVDSNQWRLQDPYLLTNHWLP
jgi:glycosyltransferase involved in cell wall biosynthesis